MPNGRFISHGLGDSEKFANLANELHRVAYMLVVTWSDEQGRFLADAVSLRGKLYTRLPWNADQVEAALQDMARVGLVHLYRVAGKRYGLVDQWHEHQKIQRDADGKPKREGESKLPPPPQELHSNCDTAATAAAAPLHIEVEVEVEGKGKEEVQERPTSESLSASPTRVDPYASFVEAWNEHRGNLPGIRTLDAKRKRAIDTLRKEHGAEALDLFRDAVQAVAADDYWVEKQYGFTNLIVAGRVLEKADKWRAGPAQLGTANTRMATQVHRWAQALDALDERPVN